MTKMPKILALRNSGSVRGPVFRTVGGWWASYRSWRLQHAASRSLSRLSDFELKDIGLHRSEIGSVLRDLERPRRHRRS